MPKKLSRTKAKSAGKPNSIPSPEIKRAPSNSKKREWSLAEDQSPYFATPFAGKSYSTIDLFCGAGGLTEGFRRAGFHCEYANDINPWAIKTFQANHPAVTAEAKPIEQVDVADLRRELKLQPGELDVLVGGPPWQGVSINAPEPLFAA